MTGIERALYERRLAEALEAAAVTVTAPADAAPAAVEPGGPATVTATAMAEAPPDAVATRRRRWLPRPSIRRPSASTAVVVVPLLAAGAVWGVALAGDRLPPAETDLGRLTSLALVLAGPASAVGAIVARVWWPRLTGAVVVAGVAATVLVGRALLG
jgi:hypothetical protein